MFHTQHKNDSNDCKALHYPNYKKTVKETWFQFKAPSGYLWILNAWDAKISQWTKVIFKRLFLCFIAHFSLNYFILNFIFRSNLFSLMKSCLSISVSRGVKSKLKDLRPCMHFFFFQSINKSSKQIKCAKIRRRKR